MKQLQKHNQSGVVSIFVVIFSALLITIVTVSFVSVMIRNQQQASNADLSNSAYDAALAGVEDAKRLLVQFRACERSGETGVPCDGIRAAVNSDQCNSVKRGLYNFPADDFTEVVIQRDQADANSNDKALDQAYTCVKVKYKDNNLNGSILDGESKLLPIQADGPFSKVKISWFLKTNGDARELVLQPVDNTSLPPFADWQPDDDEQIKPPILRAQWIQTGSDFSSTDFDDDEAGSNTNTLFLYPTTVTSAASFESEVRPAVPGAPKTPTQVKCSSGDYGDGKYACSIELNVPNPVRNQTRTLSYLQLEAIYGKTDYRVELLDSTGGSVNLVGPTVDSTGRASNLFRRVKARIDFGGLYPTAGISVDGNLCKDFGITDNRDDFAILRGSCNP